MKNTKIVIARFFAVLISFLFLFESNKIYGTEVSTDFFRVFSLASLASIGWLVSIPIVYIRVYAHCGRGAFRISEIVCLYSDFVIMISCGAFFSTLYLLYSLREADVGKYIFLYLALPVVITYNRFLLLALNTGGRYVVAILIEGPVFFVSSFVALSFLIKIIAFEKCAAVIAVAVGMLIVSFTSRVYLHFSDINKLKFKYFQSSLNQSDLVFVTANGFIRNFYDNIIPIYAPVLFSSFQASQLLIAWKAGAVLLIPLKAIQSRLSVTCSKLIHNKRRLTKKYFEFVKFSLRFSVVLAIALLVAVYFGLLKNKVGIEIDLGLIVMVVIGFLCLNVIGPGGVVCEMLGKGKTLFCYQIFVFMLTVYSVDRFDLSAIGLLKIVFLIIGMYEILALWLAHKEQARLRLLE